MFAPLKLKSAVDPASAIDRDDILNVKNALQQQGHYTPPTQFGIAEAARDHGSAREYKNSASWRQKMTGVFKVKNGRLIPQGFEWEDVD